jgi:hypothetical protein
MIATQRRLLAHASLGSALGVCALVYLVPPGSTHLYPRCPVHEYLHLDCPGCGSTRALAALLHGNLSAALHFNALFVLLLPIALASAAIAYRRALRNEPSAWPHLSAPAIYATLAAALVFTVARNLPHSF